jgi:hypothetical protein
MYWRGCGLALCWTQIAWVPPRNETERQTIQLTLECFRRAKELDATILVPELEIAELRGTLGVVPSGLPPQKRGIGYRRGPLRRFLPGHWSMMIPGYFQEAFDSEGTTCHSFGSLEMFSSSMTIGGGDPRTLIEEKKHEHLNDSLASPSDPDIQGLIWPEASESNLPTLHGLAAHGQSLGIFTAEYVTPSERDQAIECWRTIYHSGNVTSEA